MRRRLFVCLAAATLALVTTGTAQAAPQARDRDGVRAAANARVEKGSRFPFSGLDLALLTAGGGPLLLIGVTLRRRPARAVRPAKEDSLTLA
jgi:hypothetical protein